MKNIPENMEITEVSSEDFDTLATSLCEWQKTPTFNHFLRETPATIEENRQFIRAKLATDESFARIARIPDRIVGILFLHSFDEKDGSLEESIRIAPEFGRRGIGTHLKKEVIREALRTSGIERIISWHSAWNRGTFATNSHCDGKILQFIENQTHLPNIGKITDDFQWEITGIPEENPIRGIPRFNEEQSEQIIIWLKKHSLII